MTSNTEDQLLLFLGPIIPRFHQSAGKAEIDHNEDACRFAGMANLGDVLRRNCFGTEVSSGRFSTRPQ